MGKHVTIGIAVTGFALASITGMLGMIFYNESNELRVELS